MLWTGFHLDQRRPRGECFGVLFALFRHDLDAGEVDLNEVVVGELVVAVGDSAQSLAFDAAEVAFDRVAGSVGRTLLWPGKEPIRLWRRHQFPTEFGGQRAHLIAFVGAVGEQLRLTGYGAEPVQQPASQGCIAPLPRRQGQRQMVLQHDGVQLGRQPPGGASDRLGPLVAGAPVPF